MLIDGYERRGTARDVFGSYAVPLPTAAEAAGADAHARDSHGLTSRTLMENAGRAAALVAHALHPGGRMAVVAGPGNNGGDGCVMARALAAWGRDVVLLPISGAPPAKLLLDSAVAVELEPRSAAEALAGAAVVVDAVLGTGARGAPRPEAAEWIRRINTGSRTRIALDLPSGIDATSGAVHDPAVNADITVCFGWPKLGMLLQPARQQCGRLIAVEIGFPAAVADDYSAMAITPAWAAARLPTRSPAAHKGMSGRLLLVAGAAGMAGAAAIAAAAAVRAGAGLVRVVSAPANREVLQAIVPEAIYAAPAALASFETDTHHALAIGPGLGTDDAGRELLAAALRATDGVPAVLDADALNLLAADEAGVRALIGERHVAITPHPGELGTLLGRSSRSIAAAPADAAREAAERFDCTVLLKGQPSVVAAPGAPLLVNTTGSSDLAAAGMGDQLTGVIGALLAAGLAPRAAAAVALFYTGRAADLAGRGRALSPRLVSRWLHRAFAMPGASTPAGALPFITFDQPARW